MRFSTVFFFGLAALALPVRAAPVINLGGLEGFLESDHPMGGSPDKTVAGGEDRRDTSSIPVERQVEVSGMPDESDDPLESIISHMGQHDPHAGIVGEKRALFGRPVVIPPTA